MMDFTKSVINYLILVKKRTKLPSGLPEPSHGFIKSGKKTPSLAIIRSFNWQ